MICLSLDFCMKSNVRPDLRHSQTNKVSLPKLQRMQTILLVNRDVVCLFLLKLKIELHW